MSDEVYSYRCLSCHDPDYPETMVRGYIQPGTFDNDPTKNPVDLYCYSYDQESYVKMRTATAVDFNVTEEYDEPYRYYFYYQGRWHQVDPPNYIYNDETARVLEGYCDFAIYEWNETKGHRECIFYCPSYNPLTVNGQEITFNYGDSLISNDKLLMVYVAPGFWIYQDTSYYYDFDIKALGGELNCHWMGRANLSAGGASIQDGDTSPKIIINGQLVIAQNYDRVYSGNNYYIYYEGTWYCPEARKNSQLIANMVTKSPKDTVDEFTELCLDPDGRFEHERINGIDLNTLTINGVTTQVNLFDTVLVCYDRGPGVYQYYTYGPGGVWINTETLSDGGAYNYNYCHNTYIPIRNEILEYDKCVELKWEDPNDITTYEPTPATWEGTIVIRKEDSAPMHRWDGVEIVDSTTRDKYKTDPYRDENIQLGKTYYYGFFPYYTATTENGHPIKFYRFTAVRRVDTGVDTNAPIILSAVADGTSVTVSYKIPAPIEGEYNSIKLYGKIGSNPKGDGNDDVSVDIDRSEDEVIVENLQPESTYYFAIITIQGEET